MRILAMALALTCALAMGASAAGTPQTVLDPYDAPFGDWPTLTVGTSFAAPRSIGFSCTSTGAVTFTSANGNTMTVALSASAAFQSLPLSPVLIALGSMASGSCTFWGLY